MILIDFGAIQSPLDPEHSGQHDDGIAVGHQEVMRSNLAVCDERVD